jgi:hypothetical protein
MELWVLWKDRRDDLDAWSRGIVRTPDRPSIAKYVVEIASVLLITVGIVGELWAGIEITSINGRLRSKNAELRSKGDHLVSLIKEATSQANSQAGEAKKHAGQLEIEAAQLKRKAESETTARIKLQSSVGWRHLTERQQEDVAADLRARFRGSVVSVRYLNGDIEGSRFAADIADAMRKAGCLVWPPADTGLIMRGSGNFRDPITRDPTGVSVQPTTDTTSDFLADAIVKELASRGFDATKVPSVPSTALSTRPQIAIIVERRPEGPQGEFKLQVELEARAKKADIK